MDTKEALELEKLRHSHIGEIVVSLNEITNQKDMLEILEVVKEKIFESKEQD